MPFVRWAGLAQASAMASTIPARSALVLYGSETGSAQDVAEEMGRIAERLRFDTEVAELNAINLVCKAHDLIVTAVSDCV